MLIPWRVNLCFQFLPFSLRRFRQRDRNSPDPPARYIPLPPGAIRIPLDGMNYQMNPFPRVVRKSEFPL